MDWQFKVDHLVLPAAKFEFLIYSFPISIGSCLRFHPQWGALMVLLPAQSPNSPLLSKYFFNMKHDSTSL